MNLSDMKLYQEFEERERAREMREAARMWELRKRKQKDFEDVYGIAPQQILSLTTDSLLLMPFNRAQEKLEKAMKVVNKLSDDIAVKNGDVDICRCIPFGKHQGRTVWEIINTEPNYALWMHDKTDFKLTDYEVKIAQYVRGNDPISQLLVD